jgi:uncharacterized membrane protein YfcA
MTAFSPFFRLARRPVLAAAVLAGVIAAPLAAFAARYIPARPLMMAVGVLIIILSIRTLILAIG